jgi:cytochrome P450
MSDASREQTREDATAGEDPTGTDPADAPLPPGPDGLPVLGNTLQFFREGLDFYDRLADYGDVVRYSIAGMEFTTLLHPDHVEYALLENPGAFEKWDRTDMGFEFAPEGLLLTDGEQWRKQRQLIQPAFRPRRIAEYADDMATFAERFVDDLDDGAVYPMDEELSALTVEILGHSLFDLDVGAHDDRVTAFATTINDRADASNLTTFVPGWVPIPSNRRFKRRQQAFRAFVEARIDERRGHEAEYDDLLSLLLTAEGEDGETMSETEVRDQMTTFLFAGHETTSLALTYTLMLLAQHPTVEERLLAEYDDVLAGDPPRLDQLDALTYTDRVMKESLRLYPPAYVLFRQTSEDVVLDDYRIPEGTKVTLPQFRLHVDDRFYDAPEAFDPDRWTDAMEDDLPEYAYFPFGGGPRHCIGMRFARMELKTVLPTILQRASFELESDPDPEMRLSASYRTKEPVKLRVQKR